MTVRREARMANSDPPAFSMATMVLSLVRPGHDGVANGVVNEALMLESDFCLRGMDVDVNILEGNRHEKNRDRKRPRRQHIPIGLSDRVHDDLVAN